MSVQSSQCACKKETEKEKYERVDELIKEYGYREDCLIQILHYAQGIFGYLPMEVQQFIAERLQIPLSKVSGVVSFYSFFSTKPRGRNTIRVCLGTACYVRGGKQIIQRLKELLDIDVGGTTEDGRFTLEVMRCIGACGLAPAMTINDKVYKQVNPDKLHVIINKYN
ncbi:MAG TPA: NAD(P)H-dependent oxidoreductase subunit E [Clostridiaceae bacterium]|nr:NAD(P)H-dependent oxidoreductase subunit E [Clostridiaceae bacterium]